MSLLHLAESQVEERHVHSQLTRHAVQVLLAAGHTQEGVAEHARVCVRAVRTIAKEEPVDHIEDHAERKRRRIGRPSKATPFCDYINKLLEEEPDLMSLEILRRCKERGYSGGKSALYDLVAQLRPPKQAFQMRFEGLPGEFTQHDFGEVVVRFLDGTHTRVRFFASRLKWSRWVQVTLVPNQQVETLVRTLLDHFEAMGGVPLCAVFDRPKTVALSWAKDGQVTEWNPTFAYSALEIGFTAEVCWPRQPNQKGSVENLVGWVKGSFFKQRRFHDMDDLQQQLDEWHAEVNEQRPSRATGVIPEERRQQELERLRAPKVTAGDLALRIPISVGPTGYVVHDTHPYSMPPETTGFPATLYLYRDRVRIVAGRHEVVHERIFEAKKMSTLPEHRSSQLAAVAGKRGKRYLKRQHLFDTGEAAARFLTEIVHRNPKHWIQEVDDLHELLQRHGPDAMNRAFRAAVDVGRFDVRYVARCLAHPSSTQAWLFPEVQA